MSVNPTILAEMAQGNSTPVADMAQRFGDEDAEMGARRRRRRKTRRGRRRSR